FERDFARWHTARHGLAVTNGTTALELALRAVGVEPGAEVIVPALSFIVTASVVPFVGARAVFVDSDSQTYQPDPDAIEAAITRRTQAVCIVHYGGYPADMDRIGRIARKHKLPLIEDCAHAHGSMWRGHGVGSIGACGTFSFQMSKALTAGEGGMVLTNNDQLAERCYSLHHLGRLESKGFYDFHLLATNLRMTEWQGAILAAQLRRTKSQTLLKMHNAAHLAKGLAEIGGLTALKPDPRITRRGYYYFLMRYEAERFAGLPKGKFVEALRAEGLPVGQAYGQTLYRNPLFQNMLDERGRKLYAGVRCEQAERICNETQVALSHTALLSRPLVDALLQAVARIGAHAEAIARQAK
ncbi:MAG: DegT/DnrJ/EryC1/StrS family aminotransferase, partial [Planctomycetota bacterium]